MSTQQRTTTLRAALRPRRVVGALTVVLLLAGWWLWLRPEALGGSTTLVTVSGESMEPGMYTGDLAIVRKTGDYAPGEVIAYRVPKDDGSRGGVVIHRILDGDAETGFRMQGDNNDFIDPWRPRTEDVTGELLLHVPHAGQVVSTLADPLMAGAVFAAITAFAIVAGGGRPEDERKNKDEEPAEPVEATP